jgi:hypothetical protein
MGFWWGSLKERGTLGEQCVVWRITLKMILNGAGWKGIYWIRCAVHRKNWKGFMNTMVNLREP